MLQIASNELLLSSNNEEDDTLKKCTSILDLESQNMNKLPSQIMKNRVSAASNGAQARIESKGTLSLEIEQVNRE